MSIDDYNPFAAPASGMELGPPGASPDEFIRIKHIECEQNLRSIAGLLAFGCPLAALGTAAFVLDQFHWTPAGNIIMSILSVLWGAGHLIAGIGLYRLRPWARRWALAISAIWLFVFPFGTFVALGAIFQLARPGAAVVLTDEYRQLILRTPNVFHQTSATLRILALMLLLLIGAILLMML